MNEKTDVEKLTDKEAREHLKLQLAQYVESQPESTQSFHRWMKRLEMAAVGLIATAFINGLYLSFAWKSIDPILIPTAWFFFAASAGPLAVLIGLHTIILKAFPPIILPGKAQKFITGSGAMWSGTGSMVAGLAITTFWSFFAYAALTQNWLLLNPMISFLGIVMGVGMAASLLAGMISTTYKKLSRTH
jgi:hypothetical protein